MDFINIKSYKVKKKTFNVIVPVLLGAIILLGNTVSLGYNLTIPKSFARQATNNSSTQNPNFQTFGSHSTTHSIGHHNDPFSQVSNSGINTIGHNFVNHASNSQHFNHPFTHVARPNFVPNSQHLNHPFTHVARPNLAGSSNSNSQNSNIVTHSIQQHTIPTVDPASISIPFSGINNVLSNGISWGGNQGGGNQGGGNHNNNHNGNNPWCTVINQTIGNSTLCRTLSDHTNFVNQPTLNFSRALSDSKSLNLQHSDTRFKVVGPDNFRFIKSYWTSDNTPHAVDVGTSANSTFLLANPQDPNLNLETDINQGPTTLAVSLQYEGVVQLAGLTAAMKLPHGFNSTLPLLHNTKRFDIAFSNYIGNIYPGQGVTLYFPVNVTNNTKVQPYVAPLALHTLRSDLRTSTDSIDATQQDQFASVLDIQNATLPFFDFNNHNNKASSIFIHNYDLTRQYSAINELLLPYDFVNQVIPVAFEVTGQEFLDIQALGPNVTATSSPYTVLVPPGIPTKVRILLNNTGDAPIYDTVTTVSTRDESAIAATVVPSATNIPNVVQQNAILPMVIVGPTQQNTGFIAAGGTHEFDVTIVPSFYVGGTVENLFVNLAFTNSVSEQSSLTIPIGVEILPVTGQGALHGAIAVPHEVTTTPTVTNPISNAALSAMLNNAVNQNPTSNTSNENENSNAAGTPNAKANTALSEAHSAASAAHGASSGSGHGGAGGGGR